MGANNTNISTDININQIKKRLESPRLKLKDNGIIFEMKNDRIGIVSIGLKIYETKSYKIIQEIKNDNEIIEKILELDNNDLIMSCIARERFKFKLRHEEKFLIKIYRLKNDKYELFQTIDNDNDGFEMKIKKTLNFFMKYKTIYYHLDNIIKLSQNKFITISDLGFKIYSLSDNEDANSKYTLYFVYKNESHDRIEYICPINENELIIIYFTSYYSLLGSDNLDIEKYDIKNNKTIKKIYHKKKSQYGVSILFTNYIIIKDKYLVIMILGIINIFDIIKGEKKLAISSPGYSDYHCPKCCLYNWVSMNDDIFLLTQEKQFIFIQYDEFRNKANIIGSFTLDIIIKNNTEVYSYNYNRHREVKKLKNKNEFYNFEDGFINFY